MDTFKQAISIIEALTNQGFEAYFVGGAVRDRLRGVPAHDIDIATNARPLQILEIAKENKWKAITVGLSFGVVKLVIAKEIYEVATFRAEKYVETSRQPSEVYFKSSLRDDLSRRDFTINAIAMDRDGKIIDPFGGADDIEAGIIRCVGDPVSRFREDPLRMFRAVRFVAQLGYKLEDNTYQAIKKQGNLVRILSVERVVAEIERTWTAQFAALGLKYYIHTGLFSYNCRGNLHKQPYDIPILPELSQQSDELIRRSCYCLDLLPDDLILRWAAVLLGLETAAAHEIVLRLKLKKTTAQRIGWVLQYSQQLINDNWLSFLQAQAAIFNDKKQLRRALIQLFTLQNVQLQYYNQELESTKQKVHQQQILEFLNRIPVYVDELNISGTVVAAKIGEGKHVKTFLQTALQKVQEGKIANTEQSLRQELDHWINYSRR